MKCAFTYSNDAELKDFRFVPDKGEDEAELYRLSRLLTVKNPAVIFAEEAKKGVYNDINDENYNNILKRVALISYFCFDNGLDVNPVKLAARLAELIMDPKYIRLTPEAYDYVEKEKARHAKEKEKKD